MTKKTPTMADLRALGRRKGHWIGETEWSISACYGPPRDAFYYSVVVYARFGYTPSEMRSALYAALSTLPDKPKPRKR